MSITRERLAELRALVEDESMSWGDIADLEGAFAELDPADLPEPAENAGWGDMLDELEAAAERERVGRIVADHDPHA